MQIEYGSDFHFIDHLKVGMTNSSLNKIFPGAVIYFSGRSALFGLLSFGISNYSWKNLYLPTYYCHDVDFFLESLPVNIYYYDDGPYHTQQLAAPGIDSRESVVVHVNYFGYNTASRLAAKNAFIIEDHTHDLVSEWALNSTADYCFASIRKTIPVPAGGLVWSPVALKLPPAPKESSVSSAAVFMKLSAMLLKKLYLEQGNVEKQDFRTLYLDSEILFEDSRTTAGLPATIINLINSIDIRAAKDKKIKNYHYLADLIQPKNILWKGGDSRNICPFGLMIYLDNSGNRDALKNYLIGNNIYPAVLWPRQRESTAADFAGRCLLIHCDARYEAGDMEFIAQVINNYYNEN